MSKSTWDILNEIDCSKYTETKQGLTYLNWAWAWGIVKKNFPDATYKDVTFDGKPYLYDENLGYLVATEVTINGDTLQMSLPVLDGANKPQKNVAYTYEVAEYKDGKKTGGKVSKTVEAASMFDINTASKRCLVKNIAMFGLGHNIYAKDVDKKKSIDMQLTELKELRIENTEDFEKIKKALKSGVSIKDVRKKWSISKEVEEALNATV